MYSRPSSARAAPAPSAASHASSAAISRAGETRRVRSSTNSSRQRAHEAPAPAATCQLALGERRDQPLAARARRARSQRRPRGGRSRASGRRSARRARPSPRRRRRARAGSARRRPRVGTTSSGSCPRARCLRTASSTSSALPALAGPVISVIGMRIHPGARIRQRRRACARRRGCGATGPGALRRRCVRRRTRTSRAPRPRRRARSSQPRRRALWRPPWPTARRTRRAICRPRSAAAPGARGTSGRCGRGSR